VGERKISGAANGVTGTARFEANDLACIRGERPVFARVAFQLESGGALVLVGANGSGKSSLLRIVAGLLKPVAGTLTWDDTPIDADWEAHRRRLHYVGHLEAVKANLTASENLDGWARFRGASSSAPGALAALGIENLADVPARFLSAGQKRRLALARLVATDAPLWLLDEPTVTLDAESTKRVAELIAGHRAGGGMVIVATHAEIGLTDATFLEMGTHAVSPAVLLAEDGLDEAEYDAW
jgi:heme exporter protein A